ncbi:MAG TPA: hypothetical protein VN193_13200 [Candidatus Angelobacter sp.]|jgi:hypothetical protein|nr:hypothetical protein [Candidatus Angelobacter sp.]
MTASALAELRAMLEAFVAGDDVSLRRANEIEALLNREFRVSPLWEQLSEPLAVYRPEGGEFLVDESGLRRQISAVLKEWTSLTKDD